MNAIGATPDSTTSLFPWSKEFEWDAIRVPRYIGLATLTRLPEGDFPVIVDPAERTVYFLIPAGETDDWERPDTRILVVTHRFLMPPI
ncbi:hypothetical protein ACQPYK_45905 [Streptosporangium sp. CA-135522]|uniref:hypothetical protein n=1 Tax=Streptosporangium sp. CA-135522 TaxID=3240072 RepID=UPI003D89D4B6